MPRRPQDAELPRHYEGEATLAELLAIAGSPASVEEVKGLFSEAQAEGDPPSEVFPQLFEGEPHFPSPEVARRLYGNLFGLWDRVAAGELGEPAAGRPERAKPPPPPEPPARLEGKELTDAFVEQAFRYLSQLPEKESVRLRDRFDQRESDLAEAVRALRLAPAAEEAGLDLAFELWAMCELAHGEAGRTDFSALRRADAPPPAQPALLRYLDECLTEAALDEEEPLSDADRQKLEPLLRAAIGQLAS